MMGMIYRRKKRDPATGKLEEQGPYWMKYYIEGRAIQESTKVFEKEQAKKILKVKEGEVAAGIISRAEYGSNQVQRPGSIGPAGLPDQQA
ncbi:MAG: hypothetical protein IPM88_14010 [Nitrospira sp.]|nr:hypothetical protein [Nitrospira sp.]